ncbi:2-phospho-L-lactate guanylyltransferase [Variovorax sp. LjRoot178]|uniref:2-phospho-L-lactate guanylyltransferase n=1 Tax=Variovorax sp. LjRoot178 TaxID=3342277 RepID=UPI003ECDFAE2
MQELRVLIFAKSLRGGKSRLQSVLGPLGRRGLVRSLLKRTFVVAIEYAGAANCTVVSHCDTVLDLADTLGVRPLRDPGEGGLNGAATFALQEVRRQGADHVLLMATDMPWLRVEDLRAVAETGMARSCAVIGADRHGTGTNLLFIPAGADMRVSYGPGSLQRHLDEGYRAAGGAVVYRSEEVGFDIDTPEDLRQWGWSWGPVNPDAQPAGRGARLTPSEVPGP